MACLFVYGSLMSPAVLHRVLANVHGSAGAGFSVTLLQQQPAILQKHTRFRLENVPYPGMLSTRDFLEIAAERKQQSALPTRMAEQQVDGFLLRFSGTGPTWLHDLLGALDAFEAVDQGLYERVEVAVQLEHAPDIEVRAWTYIWSGNREQVITDADCYQWSLDTFLQQQEQSFLHQEFTTT